MQELMQSLERHDLDDHQKDVACSCDVLAQYLREAVARARFGSMFLANSPLIRYTDRSVSSHQHQPTTSVSSCIE